MSPDERAAEIAAIITMVNTPIQHALGSQEVLRRQIEALNAQVITQQEHIKSMEDDVKELKGSLEEIKKAIIDNQEKKFRQVIYVQAAILLALLGAAAAYIVPLFGHVFFHQ